MSACHISKDTNTKDMIKVKSEAKIHNCNKMLKEYKILEQNDKNLQIKKDSNE